MKSANPVKMLAAFALVLLVFSVTEGRIMNKCELKAQLDAAQFQQITVMEETITVNSLISRLVCKASISAFNTSFVKNTTVHNKEMKPAQAPPQVASQVPPQAPSSGAPPQASPRRGPPQAPSSGAPPQASPHRGPPQAPSSGAPPQASPRRGPPQAPPSGAPPKVPQSGVPPKVPPSGSPPKLPPSGAPSSRLPPQAPAGAPPKHYAQAPTKGPRGSGHETQQPRPTTAAKVVGHLYGVFQLSDQLACDSGMIPSLNVCNMTCSALTDDDITDDIACLKALTNFMKAKPKEILFDVKKIVEMMLVKECHSVVPPNYFAECV
ncbi:lysine-rich arabinogalactan protein 19 [Sinocyclocheilus anshuiensis]|uniref:lysine-rich arabinogalactan protein 19 n=1 Tax=Sinocyclocheilus anshuiensis TaxID=1608454 RepID=UPI0007B99F3A|nr:PREDICTED: lysine-rich arabinogalactan protein 19-like [Sinocyclocheilus anshuiensis]